MFYEDNKKTDVIKRTVNSENVVDNIGISCIICGEMVKLTSEEILALKYDKIPGPKVCDKCKAAVLHMRDLIIY